MQGIQVKRGVESTLERVFKNTGRKFDSLSFSWTGSTAAVAVTRTGGAVDARVIFPSIDETKDVPKTVFNNLIGYAIHELGHVWFTDDEPWDFARINHGPFVNSLVNGLEDPRIEQKVVDSGYAPNSYHLFESLTNAVLAKDGYVEADDFKNIPFLLAIEGRRLNGYQLICPSVVDESPWAADLHWALTEAHRAKNTREICGIAIELNKRLQQNKPPEDKPEDKPEEGNGKGNPQDGQDGQPGQPTDGQQGEQGKPDQKGKKGDKKGDKKDKKKGKGKGEEPREVEPRSFIEDEMGQHQPQCDKNDCPRPAVDKPYVDEIKFA